MTGVHTCALPLWKECFDACGDDDVPFIEGKFNSDEMYPKRILLEDPLDVVVHLEYIFSDNWQIKRAEPKVLRADEWYHKHRYCQGFDDLTDRKSVV